MKKYIPLLFAFMFAFTFSKAQTTARQFTGVDCNSNPINLFNDLDAGKAVILFYYMPSCGTCPPPAQKIQKMANTINAKYPGKVKGYAFPFQNSTTCAYSSTWVSSNSLSTIYSPMDSGATDVAYYGGFGMPTVVLVGGMDHKVLFSTLDFGTSDTTIMRDKIMEMINGTNFISQPKSSAPKITLYPNPAKDKLEIEISSANISNLKIEILNILGQTIPLNINEMSISGSTKWEINTQSLSNGIYTIRVSDGLNLSVSKFTISH